MRTPRSDAGVDDLEEANAVVDVASKLELLNVAERKALQTIELDATDAEDVAAALPKCACHRRRRLPWRHCVHGSGAVRGHLSPAHSPAGRPLPV